MYNVDLFCAQVPLFYTSIAGNVIELEPQISTISYIL